MKSCCDEYCSTHGCNQGRNCPVRKTRLPGYRQEENIRRSPFVVLGVLLILILVPMIAVLS